MTALAVTTLDFRTDMGVPFHDPEALFAELRRNLPEERLSLVIRKKRTSMA